ncbi:YeeE/YedE family protein [Alphaproteobacteria bacterium]|nr:YeeE/YedE family protein [Alphaproteobacteria bacterium]
MTTEFTPLLSLAGGALIGLSALLLMATNGRIAGISGIVSRILPPHADRSGLLPAIVFVVGLLLAAPLYKLVTSQAPEQTMTNSTLVLIIAGLLVGFGSVLGGGCTSGHGVCGLSRLSQRSMVATGTFMVTAFITVYILRHVLGAPS